MADTAYGVNANEAVKLWSSRLDHQVIKKTWIGQYVGESSDALCQIKTDLQKSKGDRIRTILRMNLTGQGTLGDETAEGNEEALVTHTDDVIINMLRHNVRSQGEMTEQRIPYEIRDEAYMALEDWWVDRMDTWAANQLAGNASETNLRYTGMNSPISADASHRILAGNATTEAGLERSASDIFSLALIDRCVLKARTLSIPLRKIDAGGQKAFVMFITPEQHYDLRRNTATAEWQDIQKAAIQGGKISDNPIWTGALGMYNGTILHEQYRLPTITTADGADTGGRAVFCGAQALALAFGRGSSMGRWFWREELFDYGNKLGVLAGCMAGMKKTVYNSQDFSTITVSTVHSAAADSASGR